MDSPFTWALIAMALVAMVASYTVPRAWWWILAGGISFFTTTLFLDYGNSPEFHPILTFGCDALVFMIVVKFHREDWELGVAIAFLASVFSSLLRLLNFISDDWVYPSLLELSNLAALLCITGTGIVDRFGKNADSPLAPLRTALHSPRDHI